MLRVTNPGSRAASPGRIFGVLGNPVAQSMSPVLHGWALAQKNLEGTYTAWNTPPDALPAFMETFRKTPYQGASVTIPHKEAVIPFLDRLTDTAKIIGAANTLFWEKETLVGHNTDMEGFLAPLCTLAAPREALVLGAGGATRAILAALATTGAARVVIAARDITRGEALAEAFSSALASIRVIPWEDRLCLTPEPDAPFWAINTTPLGMRGKAEGISPLPREWFAVQTPRHCLAYDLVYNPLETPFLALAKQAGWQCRDGLDMFIAQAAAQFRLWTGCEMPVPQARALLAEHLAAKPVAP